MLEERPRGPQYPRQGLGGALPSAQGSGDILPQALRPLRLASLGSSGPPFVRFLKDEEILMSYTDGQLGFTALKITLMAFPQLEYLNLASLRDLGLGHFVLSPILEEQVPRWMR